MDGKERGKEEIHDIFKWPKSNGFYAKVPSLVYYRNKNGKLLDWGRGARLLSLRVSIVLCGSKRKIKKLMLTEPFN